MSDSTIVRAAIHPAIGFARVGNSKTGHFIAQQVTEPPPKPPGFYRDATGALKREGVEFRLYGYNAAGEVVAELTPANADITWSAHVVNRKAEWYQWVMAMDIPEAASTVLSRRNPKYSGAARQALVIDGGEHSLSASAGGSAQFVGQFTGTEVALGEMEIVEAGRLLFLGGFGQSASPTGAPIFDPAAANGFINADDWFDDTSDGPISATVRIGDKAIPVDGAWVVTAPPNYAPQVKAERTMYDLLHDLYVRNGWLPAKETPSFTEDIYPLLKRLSDLQWVNQGFLVGFGHGSLTNFDDPTLLAKLSAKPVDGYDRYQELRRQMVNNFRIPVAPNGEPLPWSLVYNPAVFPAIPSSVQADNNQLAWPWVYGDAMNVPASDSPRQNSSVTPTQYAYLQMWAEGRFVDDWGQTAPPYTDIAQVPLPGQPAMLDRAALDFALADAFHPGCELTWPMRHLTMYYKPFRIRRRPAGTPEPKYGKTLNQQQALAINGPLYQQGPGDLNRWMGLPWQGDTAFCRSGYQTDYDPFVPTFWPARVPNQVLSEDDYKIVIDPNQSKERRIAAFNQRSNWNDPLGPTASTAQQMEAMVQLFGSMGLLEVMPGVQGDPEFPDKMMVATYGPGIAQAAQAPSGAGAARLLASGRPRTLPRGANFHDRESAAEALNPTGRRKD